MYETPKSKTTFSPLHISPELASIAEGLTKFSGANNQLILNAFKSSSAFKDQLKANGALFELSGLAAKLGQFIKPATIDILKNSNKLIEQVKGHPFLFENLVQSAKLGELIKPAFLDAFKNSNTLINQIKANSALFKELRHAAKYSELINPAAFDLFKSSPNFRDYINNQGSLIGSALKIDFDISRVNFTEDAIETNGEKISYEQINREVVPKLGLTNSADSMVGGLTLSDWLAIVSLIYAIIWGFASPFYNAWADGVIKNGSRQYQQDIKKEIKRMSNEEKSNFKELSFVFKDELAVHQNPKQRSKKIASIVAGSVVIRLNSRKDWTLVYFEDGESELKIQGWVLTRYIKKLG